MLNQINKIIFGYDIFISYSRKDSLDYAYAIAQHFMKEDKNYVCYIDQLASTKPGHRISNDIIRAIKNSKGFVLIGSEGAQLSQEGDPIPQEIDIFINQNSNKFIIPLNINSAIKTNEISNKEYHATSIEKRIFGLTMIDESLKNFESKKPSEDVLERIENALKFTKRSIRLRNITIAVLLSVLSISGIAAIFVASKAKAAEKAATERAHSDSLKRAAEADYNNLTIASNASDEMERDPTKAVAMALKSYSKKKYFLSERVLLTIYNSNNIFYKKIFNEIWEISLSKAGDNLLYTQAYTRKLYLLNTISKEKKLIDKKRFFSKAFLINNDSEIFALDTDGNINIYTLNGILKNQFKTNLEFNSFFNYIPEINTVACARFDTLYLLDYKTGEMETRDLSDGGSLHNTLAKDISYLKKANTFVITDALGLISIVYRSQSTIVHKNLNTISLLFRAFEFKKHTYLILAKYKTTTIYELPNFDFVTKLTDFRNDISIITFSNDVKNVVVSSTGGEARLYKISELFDHPDPPYITIDSSERISDLIVFSPDDRVIAVAKRYGEIKLFNIHGELLGICRGHAQSNPSNMAIEQIEWTADSKSFISRGRADRKSIQWDLNTIRKFYYKDHFYEYEYAANKNKTIFTFVYGYKHKALVGIYAQNGDLLDSLTFIKDIKICAATETGVFIYVIDKKLIIWDKRFLILDSNIDIIDRNGIEYSANFSTDERFLRFVSIGDKINSDTSYFDIYKKEKMPHNIASKLIFPGNDHDKKGRWKTEWEVGEWEKGRFILTDSNNNTILLASQNTDVMVSSSNSVGGVVISNGQGMELFVTDVDAIIHNFEAYHLENY